MIKITKIELKIIFLILLTFVVFSCGKNTVSIIEKIDSNGKIIKIKLNKFKNIEIHQSFYSNGEMEYKAEYKNGIPDGKVIYWNIKGELISNANYENGKLHGVSSSYFENGNIASKIEYFYGVFHGEYETYHENGRIKSNQIYEYGKPISKLLRFNEEGIRIYQP